MPRVMLRFLRKTVALSHRHKDSTRCQSTWANTDHITRRPTQLDLESYRRDILDTRKSPLGSLSAEQWDDSLLVIHFLLRLDLQRGNRKPFVKGTSVDSADRLFERLVLESTVRSPAAKQKASLLPDAARSIWDNWVQKLLSFPTATIPQEKTYRRWKQIKEWGETGFSAENLPWNDYVLMVEAYTKSGTTRSFGIAAELLMHVDTNMVPDIHHDRLKHCYHEAIRLGFEVEDEHILQNLIDSHNQFDPAGHEALLNSLSTDRTTTSPDGKVGLSDFELGSMSQHTINTIDSAEASDFESIRRIAGDIQDGQLADDDGAISIALVRYFIRVADPMSATQPLLSVLKAVPDDMSSVVLEVIELLQQCYDSESPWRAEEILSAYEDSTDKIDSYIYVAAAKVWQSREDRSAPRKTLALLLKAEPLDLDSFRIALKALQSASVSVGPNEASWVCDKFDELYRIGVDGEDVLINEASAVLAKSEDATASFRFISSLAEKGSVIQGETVGGMLKTFVKASPDEIVGFLGIAEANGATIDYECYHEALAIILPERKVGSRDIVTSIFQSALTKLDQLKFQTALPEIQVTIGRVIDFLCYCQLEHDAQRALYSAEETLLGIQSLHANGKFPIPAECYKRVLELLVSKGLHEDAEKLFERVKRNGRDYANMVPDADFYMFVLASLSKSGQETITRREELLGELIEQYRSSGDSKFKPRDRLFNGLVHSYRQELNATAALDKKQELLRKATVQLDRMIDLEVEFSDPFIFSCVTHMTIISGLGSEYSNTMDTIRKMEQAGVQPDRFLLMDIFRACYRAQDNEKLSAVGSILQALSTLRTLELQDVKAYELCTRALARCISTIDSKTSSSVWTMCFNLCCEDGLLSEDVRHTFSQMAGPGLWDKHYVSNVTNGEEPTSWRENVPNPAVD